ncbi:quinone oxidoreductase PIG3-like [Lytechinus variegatus]|uniref:quinone oxidoreductase PIG3-like n=1 Tax=Lytechinus variegatus TaxID=7654 RepID=UPI001BB1AED8|nr:quinone oxidoreductase PIG3-like [Lytechinus variegatus]XP_041463515.1 quinone oxidoreductase PIG3-like [Lytechinus variegatus]
MMQAVQQSGTGGPEVLGVVEVPIPKPGPHELLMKIHSSAINRADTLQRRGLYPVPPGSTSVFGLEAAGEVYDLANSTPGKWKKGDRVMALLPGGGNAQYSTAHEDHLIPVPDHLTFQEAAAIPEVWLTAFQLLYFIASLKKGDIVLIHAGGSGVGTAATQLVKEAGGIPIVTAGTEAKLQKARSLGAAEAFNYKEVDFAEKVLEVTQGKGVNIVLDCVGGSYWEKNVKAMAPDATWVLYGLMGGPKVEGALLGAVLRKRISIRGTTLRPRSDEYKAELIKAFTERALPHFTPSSPGEQPHFQPIVDRVFQLEEISAAHQYMDENKTMGKVILSVTHSTSKPSDEL